MLLLPHHIVRERPQPECSAYQRPAAGTDTDLMAALWLDRSVHWSEASAVMQIALRLQLHCVEHAADTLAGLAAEQIRVFEPAHTKMEVRWRCSHIHFAELAAGIAVSSACY